MNRLDNLGIYGKIPVISSKIGGPVVLFLGVAGIGYAAGKGIEKGVKFAAKNADIHK